MDPSGLADAFASLARGQGAEPGALRFLHALGYVSGSPPVPAGLPETIRGRQRILGVARLCRALFRLRHKGGAEVVLVGATAPAPSPADPARATISAGGRGVSLAGAFESCMGEMAERLLARAWNPLAASSGSAPNAADLHPEWIARLTGGEAPATAAAPIAAEDTTGAAVAFPAAALPALRRSTAGCAAAPDRSLAIRHALFELAERHAVALWWYGGRPPAQPPGDCAAALARIFGPETEARRRWLLELRADGPPVIAALSTTERGEGLVLGAAAGATAEEAALRAALELCQMEAGEELALARRAALGEAALAPGERLWSARRDRLGPDILPQLTPHHAPADRRPAAFPAPCYLFDLAAAFLDFPAVRAASPALITMADAPQDPRIAAEAARNGADLASIALLPPPI